MTAATVDCPLCGVTVLIREPDPVAAVTAAGDALDQHLTDHYQHLEGETR